MFGSTLQARKSMCLCLAGLRIRRFDPIAEASELPDHSRCASLLRLFGDRRAAFFVTNSLMQDQPDQPTLSMGDGPDGLIVSQARNRAAIHDLEDASFGPGCGIGGTGCLDGGFHGEFHADGFGDGHERGQAEEETQRAQRPETRENQPRDIPRFARNDGKWQKRPKPQRLRDVSR